MSERWQLDQLVFNSCPRVVNFVEPFTPSHSHNIPPTFHKRNVWTLYYFLTSTKFNTSKKFICQVLPTLLSISAHQVERRRSSLIWEKICGYFRKSRTDQLYQIKRYYNRLSSPSIWNPHFHLFLIYIFLARCNALLHY